MHLCFQQTVTSYLQWQPLNLITLGQRETDNIKQMKTIFELPELHILEQDKHGKFDDINQRITLSVITLTGFRCTKLN